MARKIARWVRNLFYTVALPTRRSGILLRIFKAVFTTLRTHALISRHDSIKLTIKRAGDMQEIGKASATPFRPDFAPGFADEVEIAGFVVGGEILEHPDALLGREETGFGDEVGKVVQGNGWNADEVQDRAEHLPLLLGSRFQSASETLGGGPTNHGLKNEARRVRRLQFPSIARLINEADC